MAAKVIDMTGKRYGNVIALRKAGVNATRGYQWEFLCDCGCQFIGTGSEVRYGRITSCPSCAEQRSRAAVTTHGLTKHPLYIVWCGMKARCSNPQTDRFKDYGGRGISVCERWNDSFPAFLSDMGDRPTPEHTLERRNTNGNYEPANCEWATRAQQANNKRNNRSLTINGETKTLAQWASEAGVTESGIRARLRRGVTGAALLEKNTRAAPLVFRGQHKTLEGWAEEVGIKKQTLSGRLYVYGWSLERALTERVSK